MQISAEEIGQLIQPLLDENNLILCEIRISGSQRQPLIQIFIDRMNGSVSIDDCAIISRPAMDLLDLSEKILSNYQLEISSPGIDYPMKELWQFRKNIGRSISSKILGNLEGSNNEYLTGKILNISDEGLIEVQIESEIATYTVDDLAGAKVVIETVKKKKTKRKRNETRRR